MKKLYALSLLLLSFFFVQCAVSNDEQIKVKTTIDLTSKNNNKNLFSPRDLFKDVSYIKLSESDNFLLASAKKIDEFNQKLFILDDKKHIVVVYNLNGSFIGQLGKKGLGPEEYQGISDFVIDTLHNTVLLYSRADRSILEYGSDLSFKRKFKVGLYANQIGLLDSGNIALYSYLGEDESLYNINIFNYGGKLISSKMPFPTNTNFLPNNFSGFINGSFYTYPFSSIIYKIDEEKKNDMMEYEINFIGKRTEKLKFDHSSFFKPRALFNEQILGKFTIGGNNKEILFYYTFRENENIGFTLGLKLANGQTFGHKNLIHRTLKNPDPFVNMFFVGPYNLPNYSQSSDYYYVLTNIDSMTEFQSDTEENLKKILKVDKELHKLLTEVKSLESPILLKFKLKKSYE